MENSKKVSGPNFLFAEAPAFFDEPNVEFDKKIAEANKIGLGDIVRNARVVKGWKMVKNTDAATNFVFRNGKEVIIAAKKAAKQIFKRSKHRRVDSSVEIVKHTVTSVTKTSGAIGDTVSG